VILTIKQNQAISPNPTLQAPFIPSIFNYENASSVLPLGGGVLNGCRKEKSQAEVNAATMIN